MIHPGHYRTEVWDSPPQLNVKVVRERDDTIILRVGVGSYDEAFWLAREAVKEDIRSINIERGGGS